MKHQSPVFRDLKMVSRLFDIQVSMFADALGIAPDGSMNSGAQERTKRLRNALLGFRKVLPHSYFPQWAHTQLPNWSESPLDILKGANGFDEFVRLLEGIARGDFS